MVRLRQLLDRVRHRLLFVPVVFVLLAIGLTQLTLQADRQLNGSDLPAVMLTTVEGARSMLSTIAAGLIASVTLLLSMMLVAVQLASSQFSPRTVRNWIGDRTLQRAIGLVLGTVVYCLLVMRETRTISEGQALTPHLSAVVAVVLGVFSLIAVVRAVDHVTDRLRIGSVASGIMKQTLGMVESDQRLTVAESPAIVPAFRPTASELERKPPAGALAVTAQEPGWVQQIDSEAILAAAPHGSTVHVTIAVGAFAFPNAPLAWISPHPGGDEDGCLETVRAALAIGDARTMQQDIGFGLLQMVDIALRALSPGVNDPNTANDLIVHIGVVMLSLWERPIAPATQEKDGRTLVLNDLEHGDYLHAAFDPLRLYGTADPQVTATMIRTLSALHSETKRRDLPGPLGPVEEVIAQVLDAVEGGDLSGYDKSTVYKIAPSSGD